MGKKLFPKEIIEDTSEANFSKHSVKTKLIYITVLAALAAIMIVLPLVHVTVSVKSPGIVQPLTNRNQLVALVSGNIEELYIEENSSVVRGQTVAKISSPVLQEQGNFNMQRQQRVNEYLSDLRVLLALDTSRIIGGSPAPPEVRARETVTEIVPETETAMEETAAEVTSSPSPLLSYRDQILRAVRTIKNAAPAPDNSALQNARTEVWRLLHLDSSFIVNQLVTDQQEKDLYRQALSRFKDQVSEPLENISEAREKYDQIQLSDNGPGVVSNEELSESMDELQTGWEELLSVLNESSFALLESPPPVESDSEESAAPGPESDPEPEETAEPDPEPEPQPEEFLNNVTLATAKYRSSMLEFRQQARNVIQEIKMAQQKYNRDRELFERQVISEETFENSSFALESARNDFQLLFEQQLNRWQADQVAYQEELEQLGSESEQLGREQDRYVIRAPVSGTIQNMAGIYEGSPVAVNQTLAEISPDTALVVECYVPPKDIGLLKEGMEARFQVSAYDYNQWGLLTGRVEEISSDVIMMNDQPVFRVRASLDQAWLELENGYRGNLKKGMSLVARFNVTERSLFQLLYDNLDDWLNPVWDDPENIPAQQAAM